MSNHGRSGSGAARISRPKENRPGACEATLIAAGLVSYAQSPGSPYRKFYGDLAGFFGPELDLAALHETSWDRLVHEEDRGILAAAEAGLEPEAPYHLSYRLKLPGGRIVPVQDSGSLSPDPATGRLRRAGILADATHLQTLEERLRYVHRMEAFGQLTSGVAHDFNNLLTLLRGYAELLEGELPGSAQDYVQEMLNAADRAVELSRQLQLFSRVEPSVAAVVDPVKRVIGLTRMLRRMVGEEIEFVVDVAEESGFVQVAPSQIDAMVMQLVAHAREGLPPGSRLGLSVAFVEIDEGRPEVLSEGWLPGEYLRITADARVSGDPGDSSRLSPLDVSAFDGADGVWELWSRTGGKLTAENGPGEVRRLKAFLPRVRTPEAREEDAPPPSEAPRGKGETVLVVEDDPETLKLYSSGIEGLGYKVLTASHGEEALRLAMKHPEIDLVLSDLVMPLMGGVELAERLKESLPGAATILMSGYSPEGAGREPGRYRGYPFFPKPFSLKTLAHKLRECIETR